MNYIKLLCIIVLCIILFNINSIYYDVSKYDVNKFTKKQLIQKKWRCIDYYYNEHYYTKGDIGKYKYLERSCNKYKYDYINFILERSNILFYNFIIKIIIYTIIIYFYYSIVL